jgi:glutamine amidotransferase PdxT
MLIKNGQCVLRNAFGHHIATWNAEVDLYKLDVTNKSNVNFIAAPTITIVNKANLWHLRLGHINQNRLKKK